MHHALALLESASRALAKGEPVALCTIVRSRGSTPQADGALLLLYGDTRTQGTLGGGCVEAEVRRQALDLLNQRRSGVLTFQLDHDYGWDDGLICGGLVDVAVAPLEVERDGPLLASVVDALSRCEAGTLPVRVDADGQAVEYRVHFEAVPKLLIAGAGHIGVELARQAVRLDFDVRVFDDRADLLSAERFRDPIGRVVGPIEKCLVAESISENTYVVIVTRGHKHDEQALQAVIGSPARYIGMIGSRRKCKLIFDDLAATGVARERLERVHAPIGLPIDAVTVPEIAISIVAQLIETRRKGRRRAHSVEGPLPCETGSPAAGAGV